MDHDSYSSGHTYLASLTRFCHPDLPVRVRTQTGDPGESICFLYRLSLQMAAAFPTRPQGRHSHFKVTRLYGFPGGTACEFAILPY